MNVDTVRSLLGESKYYEQLIGDESTVCVLVYGSIPRDDFIDGWSDIDLLFLVNNPNLEYFRVVGKCQQDISVKTGIKTGLEVLSYPVLKKSSAKKDNYGDMVKFALTVFYKNSPALTRGVLFTKEGFELPTFDHNSFDSVEMFSNASDLNRFIFKLLPSTLGSSSKKFLLRKMIKITLPLIRIHVLVKQKKLIDDFDSLLECYTENEEIDISCLQKNFEKRFTWKDLGEDDIDWQEIETCWRVFLQVCDELMKVC